MKYSPESELHLDVNTGMALEAIEQGRELFDSFGSKWKNDFDLRDPNKINAAYEDANKKGVFDLASDLRMKFFGKDMHFYGVSYLWDRCIEGCVYCAAAITNRNKFKPRSLSVEQAVEDVGAVMTDGHTHICLLSGEDPTQHPNEVVSNYLSAIDKLGLDEIIINMEPPKDNFKLWRESIKDTAVQFRIFQETYNRQAYSLAHPQTKSGMKHDFDYRHGSQLRALKAGIDNVGLGVLFGNHFLPIEEINGLASHAELIYQESGKWPARICLPSAKRLKNIPVTIPYSLESNGVNGSYEKSSELIYALTRLILPHISLVSSERDPPTLLAKLDDYATCTTLNVHPGVGDNIAYHKGEIGDQVHFEQAPSYSRNPSEVLTNLRERGFNPIHGNITSRNTHQYSPETYNVSGNIPLRVLK